MVQGLNILVSMFGKERDQSQVETEHEIEDDLPAGQVATDVEDDSGDESEDLDDGVVKITSDEPRVAARSAAILKMVGCYSHCSGSVLTGFVA